MSSDPVTWQFLTRLILWLVAVWGVASVVIVLAGWLSKRGEG